MKFLLRFSIVKVSCLKSGCVMGVLVLWVVFLAPFPLVALGRIEGQILNGTTNQPVANQAVELLQPGNDGMRRIAETRSDAAGHFLFAGDNITSNTFYLLEATHEGVDYHAPVRLGENPSARLNFKVYDSTPAPWHFHISSARFLVRAQGDKIRVEELFAIRNDSRPAVSYVNPNGTFFFNLAPDAGQPSVAVAGEMNLPLPQAAQAGKSPGEYFIQYPLKPGLTVVMVEYEADYSSESFRLADSVPYPIDQIELDVAPATLAVKSAIFKPAGTDADTGGQKLVAENLKPDTAIEASFQGAAPGGTSSQNNGDQDVKELPNAMTRLGVPLLGCFLLVLLWAMGVRVSKEWSKRDLGRAGSPAQKELEAKLEKLLDSLANLDELFDAGKIPEKKYWRERLDLKAKLVVLLKKSPPAFLESYATRHNPH